MVTRKAIIIGNSGGYRNLNFLKGVAIDLENYKSYLLSKAGGQWYNNEITILNDPDSQTVLKHVSVANADYTFITFSGHGFINTYDSSDYVCLKDIDLSIGKLVSPSQKQTIVIDACRDYHMQKPESTQKIIFESFKESTERETRQIFDESINQLPTGILTVFSTQSNQSAGDDEYKGGHFTYSFIKSGRDWWNNSNGILRIDGAVSNAEQIMATTFITNQKPALGGQTRRLTFPPFAISKK